MKKKLFYTITKELRSVDDFEETTGNKQVFVYEIENNKPILFFELYIDNSESTEMSIQEYLNDNGYGDEDFDFCIL